MFRAEVSTIFSRDSDHRAHLEQLGALLNQVFPEASATVNVPGLIELIDSVVSLETGSMVVSRQFVSLVTQRLDSPQLSTVMVREIAEKTLHIISTRAISYEEQMCTLRLKLASVHEQEGRQAEAAASLIGIPAESGQRAFTGAQKIELYLRIGRLLLEAGQPGEAEQYVNRASLLQAETKNDSLMFEFKALSARVLDAKRKFIEAAQRFYELSMLDALPASDKATALSKAIVCTVLANPGTARTRMLATLYKDERAANLSHFGLLEKLYFDRLIKNEELLELEKELQPHQLVDESGQSIVRSAMVEHNMAAAARVYNNISIERLGELLGVEPDKAQLVATEMITSDRLSAEIDQIEGFVHFSKPNPLQLWDEQILGFCQQVNLVSDLIAAAHPEFVAGRM